VNKEQDMRYPYKRLRELSGTERSPEELAKLVTFHAFEVEGFGPFPHGLDGVVVGHVRTAEPHPDADRLRVTTVVTEEEGEARTIVCGAPNVAAGQKVAVALPGTTLPNGAEIKEAAIRGVVSSGMICAEDELGLGELHEGILVLPEDAPVGIPLAEYLGLDDTVFEIDILPNRGCDALSLRGMAREISALEGRLFPEADDALPEAPECPVGIRIETERCLRYVGAVLEGIPATSPLPLRSLLLRSGLNTRDFAVDVTNAMLLTYGQPMHAFDADRIEGGIVVRQAVDGEEMELLDGQKRTLSGEDIVIADDEGVIALAGVMGGARTAVSSETKRIVLEVASFDPSSIRKTATRHNLRSDSSYRFERFVDPERATAAAGEAIRIFEKHGATLSGFSDRFPKPTPTRSFPVPTSVFSELLGTEADLDDVKRKLGYLGLGIDGTDAEWTVSIPSFRPDLLDEWDIAEEVGRMTGYDRVPTITPSVALSSPSPDPTRVFSRELKSFLVSTGWDEIMTYPFYSEETAGRFGSSWADRHLRLENPMNADQAVFRSSLVPSLVGKVRENLRFFDSFRLFEVASVAERGKDGDPSERKSLCLAVAVPKGRDAFPFLRGALDHLAGFARLGLVLEPVSETEGPAAYLHPARSARITDTEGRPIGIAGEFSPIEARRSGITRSVAVAELSVEALGAGFGTTPTFRELPKYPYALRDLSFSVPAGVPVGDLIRVIGEVSPLLRDVELFDIFAKGETKNVAFHLVFGHDDRTVTGEEVDAAILEISQKASEDFKASILE